MTNNNKDKSACVLFVGGGSLGHVIPSLAVLEALKKIEPNIQTHFVCSNTKLEIDFLSKNKISFTGTTPPRIGISFIWKIPKALKEADNILNKIQPDIIFSKGGYASIPICISTKRRGIPIILHESDAIFGRANKWLIKYATKVCISFSNMKLKKNIKEKTIVTGNPVRESILNGSKEKALKITGFNNNKPILLILGGSQGAKTLNEAIIRNINTLLERFNIIHITGRGKKIIDNKSGYFSCEFAFNDLAHFYAATDLAISRAGGNATAELLACGIPTILVPLRGVGHDHQQKNAQLLEENGQCNVLQQFGIDEKLTAKIDATIHREYKNQKSSNLASSKIAKIILEVLAS
ncbi:MAG: UDP-N-acetylglucosamine--N-acetylmuramyl-(pentapeptide) pyrophosphoryl-undecaprenol N-acetylglucosamine transferase [Candidatus Peribacteraceae bacterium]|nr:UDP-N-acetylglucosamine--N-acetylmuramyl-(pentapeptide) pyrophosphoryl-undecaprenol N-acetylglucosamine transferase [Candidatus Peribacteraceae bacterium]